MGGGVFSGVMSSPSPRYRDALRAALERNASLERELAEARAELAAQRTRATSRGGEPRDAAENRPQVSENRSTGHEGAPRAGARASLWLPLLVVVGLCVQMVVSFVRPHPGPHARPAKASVVLRTP